MIFEYLNLISIVELRSEKSSFFFSEGKSLINGFQLVNLIARKKKQQRQIHMRQERLSLSLTEKKIQTTTKLIRIEWKGGKYARVCVCERFECEI